MNTKSTIRAVVACTFVGLCAQAQDIRLVTPISATASETRGDTSPYSLINGSGLTVQTFPDILTATHGSWYSAWHSLWDNGPGDILTFELGGVFDLTHILLWNADRSRPRSAIHNISVSYAGPDFNFGSFSHLGTLRNDGVLNDFPTTQQGVAFVRFRADDYIGNEDQPDIPQGSLGEVRFLAPNSLPVADDQTLTTDNDQSLYIELTASDSDNDVLSYVLDTMPTHGSLSGTPPNVTYIPDSDYAGDDYITFHVNDGFADSNIATITVHVVGPTPVDLIATSLQWDSGFLRCQYELTGGPLQMASTARLFWALGPTTADILSPAPISTEHIPEGTGSVGSSIPFTFTVPQHLFSSSPGASHVVMVLDEGNAISETEEGNNVAAAALLDIAAVGLGWNTITGDIDADYLVKSGFGLGTPGRVALYCANGTSISSILSSTPIAEDSLVIQQGTWSQRFTVPASALKGVVAGTTHVLFVVDSDDMFAEADEANNTKALSLDRIDLIAHSLFVDIEGAWAGYRYEIVGEEAPVGTTLALYWASGKSLQDRIEPHFFTRTLPARQPGQYTIDEPTLGAGGPLVPPVNATHILLVLDPPRINAPDGDAKESNELNNVYPFSLCAANSKGKVFGYIATTDRHEQLRYGGFTYPFALLGYPYRTTSVPRAARLINKNGSGETLTLADGSEGYFIFLDVEPGEYWLQAYSHSGDGVENNHFWAARRTVIVGCQDVVREEFTLKAQEMHLTGVLAGGSFDVTGHDVLDALSIAVIAAAPQSIALKVIAETIIADWALEASLAYPGNEAFRNVMESAIIEFEWANGVTTWDPKTGTPFEAWDVCVRGLGKSKCGIVSDMWLHFVVQCPVSLLVEDAAGRRLGRDSISGRTFEEFTGEFWEEVDGQGVLIRPAFSSEYRIHVAGTEEGSYTLTFASGDVTHSSGVVSSDTPIEVGQVDSFRFLSGLRGSVGPWAERASLGVPTTIEVTRMDGTDGADMLMVRFPTLSERDYWVQEVSNLGGTNSWKAFPGGPHNSGMVVITNAEPRTFLRLRMTERDVQPIVFAHLSNAPGSVQEVYSTSDPSIVGRVVDLASDGWVLAGFDNMEPSSFVDIGGDGMFSFDRSALEAINGAVLMEGLHTLQLLAYDGQTNLQRSFDFTFQLDTQPPTVYFSNSIVDIDTETAGLQVLEHQTLRFRWGAFDEGGIAKVELLTNGVPSVSGSVLPWEDFVVAAPAYIADANLLDFQVRISDRAGNEVASDAIQIEVIEDVDSPRLLEVCPSNGAACSGPTIEEVRIQFSESIAQGSLRVANFTLIEAGPGEVFNDGNDELVDLTGLILSNDDTLVRMTFAPLPPGVYQVRLAANMIHDRAGKAMSVEEDVTVAEFRFPEVFLTEDFDDVSPPNLPPGWTAQAGWRTTSVAADTSPNSVFVPAPSDASDMSLFSPSALLSEANATLQFRHQYDTEWWYDGGSLEVSVDSGDFQDITEVGGVFLEGGYDLQDDQVGMWSGSSGGFITTIVALPTSIAGHSVQFRWRYTSDSSVGAVGWYIDSISLR